MTPNGFPVNNRTYTHLEENKRIFFIFKKKVIKKNAFCMLKLWIRAVVE